MELSIREQRIAAGMTVSDLARRLGTSTANVSRRERHEARIKLPMLRQIATVLGVQPADLVKSGEIVEIIGSSEISAARPKSLIVTIHNLQEGRPSFPFEYTYLSTITSSQPSELGAAIVSDDAMSPTLRRGDALLIERCDAVTRAGLYVGMQGDGVHVRRVMEGLSGGTISVVTDNDAYPDFHDVSADRFPVAGRVVWIGRSFS